MTTDDNQASQPSPPPPGRLPGRGFLIVVGLVAALAIAAVWFLLPERFDVGSRRMFSFLILLATGLCAAAWFYLLSRLPAPVKRRSAVAIAVVIVAMVVSVRRVEFSGDMVPTFDFRWSPDRYDVLEAHRASEKTAQARTSTTSPAPTVLPNDDQRPPEWSVLDYRGPNRDGVFAGPKLADWKSDPPMLVWRQPVGGGYAAFVVDGPFVVTIEQRRDKEAIVAYDFDTGLELWVHDYPALFSEQLGGVGPRATPTIRDGRVYALGATGVLTCLELKNGESLWSLNILEQNRSANIDWGMSGSPLVFDDLVLVNPGAQGGSAESRSITAFAAVDGAPRWSGGSAAAGYASPMLVTLAEVPQILIFDAGGLAGFDSTNGAELWRTPWKTDFNINAAQPVVLDDDRVFISSGSGAAVYQVAQADGKWSVEEVWKNTRMKCAYACPIAYRGYLYGIDENILACIDLADGKRMWKDRQAQFGHGQLLLCDDQLLVLGEAGELALVLATHERYHELGRIQAIDGKTWNNPTLVGNRILVCNHLEMAAYDLPLAE